MEESTGAKSAEELVSDLLRERGDGVLRDAELCRALLSDAFGHRGRQGRKEVQLLTAAVEAGVTRDLGDPSSGAQSRSDALIKGLAAGQGLPAEEARWSVEVWSAATARKAGRPAQKVSATGWPHSAPLASTDGKGEERLPSSVSAKPRPPPSGAAGDVTPVPPPIRTSPRRRGAWLALAATAVVVAIAVGGTLVAANQPEDDSDETFISSVTVVTRPPLTTAATLSATTPTTLRTTTSATTPTTLRTTTSPPTGRSRLYRVINTCELGPRCAIALYSGPGLNFPQSGSAAEGQELAVVCQARGDLVRPRNPEFPQTDVWNKLIDGRWMTDAYLFTGVDGFTPDVPRCT